MSSFARALAPAVIRVESTEHGLRLYVCGRRWHHGFIGCVLVVVGGALIYDDLPDIADWWPRSASGTGRRASHVLRLGGAAVDRLRATPLITEGAS